MQLDQGVETDLVWHPRLRYDNNVRAFDYSDGNGDGYGFGVGYGQGNGRGSLIISNHGSGGGSVFSSGIGNGRGSGWCCGALTTDIYDGDCDHV